MTAGAESGENDARSTGGAGERGSLLSALVRLARPTQWAKTVFVALGPMYGLADGAVHGGSAGSLSWTGLGLAVLAFGLASSGCYVFNDLRDAEADRHHPRKRSRPIASGLVSPGAATALALALLAGAGACVGLVGWIDRGAVVESGADSVARMAWLAACVGLYVANVISYSVWLKRMPIVDVFSLASGFVLRVLGGCAAAGVEPSTWLLNSVFFLSLFLAFGKRLGERRMLGDGASLARGVQASYSDELLRMCAIVTAVGTLITYAGYVEAKGEAFTRGFNLLWLTIVPATFAMLRAFLVLEHGLYDDPTELALHDRAFQASAAAFALTTLGLLALSADGRWFEGGGAAGMGAGGVLGGSVAVGHHGGP